MEEVEVTIRSGRKVLSRDRMPKNLVETHLQVQAYMYGAISGISAGWFNPIDGQRMKRPRATIKEVV